MYGFDRPFGMTRYDEWEPDYLNDRQLQLERFNPNPETTGFDAPKFGGAAGGFSLASLIPGLGALGPIGAGLGGVAAIASLFASRSAQKEEEERRKKQEALQRAAQMSRSFEQSGWGGY